MGHVIETMCCVVVFSLDRGEMACGWDESRSWCIVVVDGIGVAVKRRCFALLLRGRAGVYFQAVVNRICNCSGKLLWTIVGLNARCRHC